MRARTDEDPHTALPSHCCVSFSPLRPACRYVSGGFYARNEGKNWIHTMLITAGLFPLSCFSIAAVLNTIAIFYQVCLGCGVCVVVCVCDGGGGGGVGGRRWGGACLRAGV